MATGSCICKKISYKLNAPPTDKAICHCRECQRLTGSAFSYTLKLRKEDLQISGGTLKEGSFIQESGIEMKYYFCGDCGTNIYKVALIEPLAPFALLQAGTLDGDEMANTIPDVELWTCRRAGWMPPLENAAQKARF